MMYITTMQWVETLSKGTYLFLFDMAKFSCQKIFAANMKTQVHKKIMNVFAEIISSHNMNSRFNNPSSREGLTKMVVFRFRTKRRAKFII